MIPSFCRRSSGLDGCDILANPQSFDGKIVRVKGTVIAGFEEFAIKGSGCNQTVNAIWLAYPESTKGKAGPVAFLRLQLGKNNPASVTNVRRSPITLDKNKDFEEFRQPSFDPRQNQRHVPGLREILPSRRRSSGDWMERKDTGLIRDGGRNGHRNWWVWEFESL